MVVVRSDEGLIEDMLQTRAWKLFEHRTRLIVARVTEDALNDEVIPEQARYALLGQLRACVTVLELPEMLITEAKCQK